MRFAFWWAGLAACLSLLPTFDPANAWEPKTTGVVIIHGKWGGHGDKVVGPLATALEQAGFIVDQPDMPWSYERLYDKTYDEAMDEIDSAALRVSHLGATRLVVIGMSMGGNAVIHYLSLGRPADAAVLLAPAHNPGGGPSVVEAEKFVAEGQGETRIEATDYNNGGRTLAIKPTASSYLSYFAPDGPASMRASVTHLNPVPLLWVHGSKDETNEFFARFVWPEIPQSVPKSDVEVPTDHLGVPAASVKAIVEWLRNKEGV